MKAFFTLLLTLGMALSSLAQKADYAGVELQVWVLAGWYKP